MGLKDALASALMKDGVSLEPLSDASAVRVSGVGRTDTFDVVVQWSDEDQTVSAYAVGTHAVPPEQRPGVMELVTRLNFGLVIGCFELDVDDGELRFRASVDLEGSSQEPALLKNLVFAAAASFGRYLPAFIDVMSGTKPVDALAKIDG
jgi:hypothetical protein